MFFLLCECESLAQRFDDSDNTRRVSISLHDDYRQLVAVGLTFGKDLCVIRLTGGCVRRQSARGGLRNVASRLTARGDTWSDLGPVCGDGVTTTTG